MSDAFIGIQQVEPFLRSQGEVTFSLGGSQISLNLQHRHERAYAIKLLMRARVPQADIDTRLFDALLETGDHVLDAGANIGFTALECFAAGAAKVVALEPEPTLFERLARIDHSGLLALPFALSSNEGVSSLVVSQSHNQGSSLKREMTDLFPTVFGTDPLEVTVDLVTIDKLTREHGTFDVWKLDIEGAEVDALHGASDVLSARPPRLIIAELYAPYVEAFRHIASNTHRHCYRACLTVDGYRLVLRGPDEPVSEEYHTTSPMYVFSMEPIDSRGYF